MKQFKKRKIIYYGRNFILVLVKEGRANQPVFIGCTDFSMTDPWIMKQKQAYKKCTELALIFKGDNPKCKDPKTMSRAEQKLLKTHHEYFGCEGLARTAVELAWFINNLKVPCVVQGHIKSALMLCTDEFWCNLKKKDVEVFAIAPPLNGTKAVEQSEVEKALNGLEVKGVYNPLFRHHIIDDEIGKEYAHKFVGKNLDKVNIITCALNKKLVYDFDPSICDFINPMNLTFKYIGQKLEKSENAKSSNGEVTLESQESFQLYGQIPKTMRRIYDSVWNAVNNRFVVQLIQNEIDSLYKVYRTRIYSEGEII